MLILLVGSFALFKLALITTIHTYTMALSKNALIVLTSHYDVFYEDGTKTGVFWSEAAHAFHAFKKAGWEVQFVSETGSYGIDEHSLVPPMFISEEDLAEYNNKDAEIHKYLAQTKAIKDVNVDDYAIFYAAGGHATLFDLPTATGLIDAARKIYANGGVVSAVCHGPAIFGGCPELVKDKKVTCFVQAAEEQIGLGATLEKFNLKTNEEILAAAGGIYQAPPNEWVDFSVADGRIVTGVNPASATSTAEKAIAALQ